MPTPATSLFCLVLVYVTSVAALPAVEIIPPVLPPDNGENEIPYVWSVDKGDEGEMEWMLMPGANGEVHVAVLTSQPILEASNRLIRPSDVEFYLYTRENRDAPERAFYKVSCKPTFQHFKPDRNTKVLIHGFGDGVHTSLMYPLLVDAYLNRADVNVFLVDWARLAGTPWYKAAIGNTQYVGTRVARLLDHLAASTGANLADVHIVGFSLGSHVAGIAGQRVTEGRISRITGLDPASVLYGNSPPNERLDATDADYVEVVHTSGGYLGYTDPIGQVDFFPNGGTWPQPGCYMDFVAVCSHRRAYYYFAEALHSDFGIPAVACGNYDQFLMGNCSEETSLYLGSENLPMDMERARGTYFLDTNPDEPFARSMADEVSVRRRDKMLYR